MTKKAEWVYWECAQCGHAGFYWPRAVAAGLASCDKCFAPIPGEKPPEAQSSGAYPPF